MFVTQFIYNIAGSRENRNEEVLEKSQDKWQKWLEENFKRLILPNRKM